MNVYVRELAIALGKLGHLADVFTCAHGDGHAPVMALAENARLIHVEAGAPGEVNKVSLYAFLPEFVSAVESFRAGQDFCYDAIFSHYWLSGWAGQTLKTRWNVPHHLMFHTLGLVKNTLVTAEDEPELRTETEKLLARQADRIIASTPREKEILVRLYGADSDRISVIPCGVNMDLFRPVDRAAARQKLGLGDEKIVLFVGRIEALKGLDRLIESLKLVHAPRVTLLVVGGEGGSADVAGLRALAGQLGPGRNVVFTGPVAQDRLPDYYGAADVFALPSYYESFGMAALEALACGTLVIATNVGDLERIIIPGRTGFIAADNAPSNLAMALDRALAWDSFAAPSEIRASVARYNWDRIADAVVAECRSPGGSR
jgi:D-inositol-3-phosphate glycosyltransferase